MIEYIRFFIDLSNIYTQNIITEVKKKKGYKFYFIFAFLYNL